MPYRSSQPRRLRQLFLSAALTSLIALNAGLASAETVANDPSWRPQVSEQLIKLPAAILNKRIDRDFKDSSLGAAIRQTETGLRSKTQTLADITAAIEMASGEQQQQLRHRLVVEKQAFIQEASAKNGMQREQLMTKRRLLERILDELGQDQAGMTESRKALIETQAAARERLEASIGLADQLLSTNPLAEESRYAREYEEKRAALASLKAKIDDHPMSQDPLIDGEALTKPDYVRHLIAVSEGELALLEVEDEILGMMAKLTSLDALALAEEVDDPEFADSDVPSGGAIIKAVDFF